MKSGIVLWLLILASMLSIAQPCPKDTLIDGGFPNGEPQWSRGHSLFDECDHCILFDVQSTWELLDTGQTIFVWGGYFPPCDTIQVRTLNQCNEVTSDTCLLLPLTGAGCMYEFQVHPLSSDAQIMVYWRSQNIDSIGVIAVSMFDGPIFDSTLFLLDTCGLLFIPEPIEFIERWDYFNPYTLEKVAILQENKAYIKRRRR